MTSDEIGVFERLSELLESSDRQEGSNGASDGDVEALFDEVDDMWIFIEAGETAHPDGRYIRVSPETVVSVQERL